MFGDEPPQPLARGRGVGFRQREVLRADPVVRPLLQRSLEQAGMQPADSSAGVLRRLLGTRECPGAAMSSAVTSHP